MKFTTHQFSKRYAAFECATFVVYEQTDTSSGSYRATGAAIILPDGRFWVGVSLCSPSDRFVRASGAAKAIGRAYQELRTSYLVEDGRIEPDDPCCHKALTQELLNRMNLFRREKKPYLYGE